MPVLMDKAEGKVAFEDACRSNHVWMQQVDGKAGDGLIALPANGSFRVFFVEIPPVSEQTQKPGQKNKGKPRIRDFIGYGARFHKLRTTEEWMKELREDEEN